VEAAPVGIGWRNLEEADGVKSNAPGTEAWKKEDSVGEAA